jgi:hypothetical protein
MDVKVRYSITPSQASLRAKVLPQIMSQLESAVQTQVDAYLKDLENHMGIHGGSAYADGKVRWDALDETQLKEAPRFWVESGKARRSVSVNMKVSNNTISAFVGVSSGSEGYQEVLWNELGFTPQNGDKLIRRPLFIPLADAHKAELQKKIRNLMSKMTVKAEI